jgi:hypothetical protein
MTTQETIVSSIVEAYRQPLPIYIVYFTKDARLMSVGHFDTIMQKILISTYEGFESYDPDYYMNGPITQNVIAYMATTLGDRPYSYNFTDDGWKLLLVELFQKTDYIGYNDLDTDDSAIYVSEIDPYTANKTNLTKEQLIDMLLQ